ncbi:MAG TPA: hypothetical protein VNM14_09010 [Planctomycetota bacterium]|nr:hypothetical protein [Planctomycetota bacterium]
MRPFARAAALVLALATLTLAQEAPDPFLPERILPQNALVHLSIPQTAAVTQDYAGSNLATLMNHPEIKSFTAPFEAWVNRRKTQPTQAGGRPGPSLNEQAKAMIGLSVDEILNLLQGPLTFSLYDVPLSEQHKLDLVFTLGAPDAGKLEKAAAALKENFKQQGNLKEGEYSRAGATVREFGDNAFRVYYTVLQKTLIVATRQERMDQIVDGAADPAFAGLREDAAFKPCRARVAPDNRHFLLLYVNVAQTLKQYRRELGDEALRILETLGLADIPSLALSMGYDGPHIRERYALMTTRQDRGLLKLLAGGTPVDPNLGLVPAGAISYSHLGVNLAEIYDMLRTLSKIDPDFERGLGELLGGYEKRVGFQLRDAFATLGSSWTAWATMPEGGGIWPDSITAVPLLDAAAFEAAVEKAAKDGGIPLEQLSFRGKTIKYLTFGMAPLFDNLPGAVPDFLSLSTTISYAVQDKTLLIASHPMALKRHFLRAEAKGKSLREDPKYASIAARLPAGEWDSHFYFDFGRVVVIGYGFVEPLLHLVRDMARDENGEQVIDLARLPLEETLSDLLGASLTSKRTLPDAVIVESRSNVGVSVSSGVAYVGVVAAIAIPTFMRLQSHGGPGGIAGNEMLAEVSLQFIRNAEDTFKNSDSDANGVADYWTRDVAGLHSLKDRSGQAIFLLDPATAAADPIGAARYELSPSPKNGYFYKMMVSDADGGVYQKDDGKTNKTGYGVCAYPSAPTSGRFTFITSEAGKTWKKDTEGKPVDKWPGKDPSKEGWTLAE